MKSLVEIMRDNKELGFTDENIRHFWADTEIADWEFDDATPTETSEEKLARRGYREKSLKPYQQKTHAEQLFKYIAKIALNKIRRYAYRIDGIIPPEMLEDICSEAYLDMIETPLAEVRLKDSPNHPLTDAERVLHFQIACSVNRVMKRMFRHDYMLVLVSKKLDETTGKTKYRYEYHARFRPLVTGDKEEDYLSEYAYTPDIDLLLGYKEGVKVTNIPLLQSAIEIWSKGWHNVRHIAQRLGYPTVESFRTALIGVIA